MSVAYRRCCHNKNLLMVHVIFITKYRHRLFYGNFCDDMRGYLYDCCVSHNWYVRRIVFDSDHVHILLQYNSTDLIFCIVPILKQCSTWYAWRDYGSFLRQCYWKERAVWLDSYFATSVGMVSQEGIERYIENQG